MTLDLRIDGAKVVRPWGEPNVESVGIAEGRIAAVGDLSGMSATQVIDAGGTYLLPGIIDTHVHIGFTDSAEEATTDTRSAAIGGVTTALVYFRSLDLYDELLPGFLSLMSSATSVDYGIHLGILHDDHLARLDRYIARFGIRSIKMYTTYKSGELRQYGILGQDDGFIFDVFRAAAVHPDLVVNVHCENDDMVRRGQARWIRPDSTPVEQWSEARPPLAEVEAIRRIALLAREAGNRLYIPHLSSAAGLEAALEARRMGTRISIETCAHYLMAGELAGAGVWAKVNPPVRTAQDAHRLWAGVAAGEIDTIGTDHAARMRKDKDLPVIEAAPGNPGIGMLLPSLLHLVNQGRFTLNDVAAAQARAASIFGLSGKGMVAPGYDADLVAVDLTATKVVTAQAQGAVSDFTPYEGLEISGWPVMTVLRGEVVARDGQMERTGRGRYVREEYRPALAAG